MGLMGFNGDFIIFYGDFMGFSDDLMGFSQERWWFLWFIGDLIHFPGDHLDILMGY